ncbi:MAG: hypothetical protein GTO18_00485 [Anaerolineales bacterium]|nr:hypothetical protein [Anaerolineales bacterium]
MIVIARLNDRAQPMDRGDIYEDPLDKILRDTGKGEVTGGGTQLSANGEIDYCEVEIILLDLSEETLNLVKLVLEKLGAPKGSKLLTGSAGEELPFGNLEGLAVYLNGTDLPESTYQDCDVNYVYEEFERLLDGIGSVHSYWEGPTETALYMYGSSYVAMKDAIADFLDSYPLCERVRVIQVA